jgi:predicted DNA-binding ribbon-helix-helix protein
VIAKRSIMINNHKTSVSLEDEFWNALKEIAQQRNQRLSVLIAQIDSERTTGNLSSALRLFDMVEATIASYDQRLLQEIAALQPPERKELAVPAHPSADDVE